MLWVVALFFGLVRGEEGIENGTSCAIQHTLRPYRIRHGPAQKTALPYYLTVYGKGKKQVNSYRAGEVYTVQIYGENYFRGFLLQARLATKEGFIIGHLRGGRFLSDPEWAEMGVKIQACEPVLNNSVMHSNWEPKKLIRVRWTTERSIGPVQFLFTIFHENDVYWERVQPEIGFLRPEKIKKTNHRISQLISEQKPPGPTELSLGLILENEESGRPELQSSAEPEPTPQPAGFNATTLPTELVLENKTEDAVETSNENRTDFSLERLIKSLSLDLNGEKFSLLRGLKHLIVSPDATTTALPKDLETIAEPITEPEPKLSESEQKEEEMSFPSELVALLSGGGFETKTEGEDADLEYENFGESARRLVVPTDVQGNCSPPPCYSGGVCRGLRPGEVDAEGLGFACDCPIQWIGAKCDKRNYCAVNLCEHGACENEVNGYTCVCEPEFVGRYCEYNCPSRMCQNGGNCSYDETAKEVMCDCAVGYTGKRCELDFDDCASNPCLNGGTCTDKLNGFECACRAGYMGKTCHRPCQNMYKSCEVWEKEALCEDASNSTGFFRVNCGPACGVCEFDHRTVRTDTPIPPLLEPLDFLIGVWSHNSTSLRYFPTDFTWPLNGSYLEELSFVVTEPPMFGTPSINFSSKAVNNADKEDVQVRRGFLTLRPAPGGRFRAALLTTGNDGVTIVEEGSVTTRSLFLEPQRTKAFEGAYSYLPKEMDREFELTSGYLRESVRKVYPDGRAEYVTKYFHKTQHLPTA